MPPFKIGSERYTFASASVAIVCLNEFEAGVFEEYAYEIQPVFKRNDLVGYVVIITTATVSQTFLGYLAPSE